MMLTRDVQGFGACQYPGYVPLRSLGAIVQTPVGPVNLPIESLAGKAFDAVWPTMRKRISDELTPTIIATGVATALFVVAANYLMLRRA